MELWIRSQSKHVLKKVEELFISQNYLTKYYQIYSGFSGMVIGTYETEERAKEILDEIQSKMKNLVIYKSKVMLNSDDLINFKKQIDRINKTDALVCDNHFEIIPINNQVILYEMPEE